MAISLGFPLSIRVSTSSPELAKSLCQRWYGAQSWGWLSWLGGTYRPEFKFVAGEGEGECAVAVAYCPGAVREQFLCMSIFQYASRPAHRICRPRSTSLNTWSR